MRRPIAQWLPRKPIARGLAFTLMLGWPAWTVRADDLAAPRLDTSGVNLQPAYPDSALAARERGAVVLNVEVTEAGTVSRILPLQSSGFDDLDRAAISTVMGWRFIPATKNRMPVVGWAKERIVFQPPDEPAAPLASATNAYLPLALDLDSGDGEQASQEKPVPCSRGEVRATVEVRTVRGAATSSASLTLSAGSDGVDITAIEYQDSEKVFLVYRKGGDERWLAFNKIASVESLVALTLSWEPDGRVTGRIGKLQNLQVKLPVAPETFGFSVRRAAATFRTPQLICEAPSTAPE